MPLIQPSMRSRRLLALARMCLSLSLFGCGGATITPDASTSDAGTTDVAIDGDRPIGDVTYYSDVRPILTQHCLSCHVAGAIAPFPLDTYSAARTEAGRIAEATRSRTMPPYLADASGACRTFRDARWLSEHEIGVLEAWRDQATPEGDATIPAPVIPSLPQLTGTISTLDTGVEYTPNAAMADDYRCFVVQAPIATGTYFVTGSEARPGNPRIAHHLIVYAPRTDEAAQAARALDAAEDGPGYTCFGGSGVNALPAALWAPGAGATLYPTHTGIQLTGGRPLIVQIHYNTLAGPGMSDRTQIDLSTVTTGVTPAYWVPIADFALHVAPHLASVSAGATERVGDLTNLPLSLRVFGTAPHMHLLGRTVHVDMDHAAGGTECLVDVPRWNFNWQMAYFYETPLPITPDDRLTITCSYDTTSRDGDVVWGEGTQDEMCIDFLYLSL